MQVSVNQLNLFLDQFKFAQIIVFIDQEVVAIIPTCFLIDHRLVFIVTILFVNYSVNLNIFYQNCIFQ